MRWSQAEVEIPPRSPTQQHPRTPLAQHQLQPPSLAAHHPSSSQQQGHQSRQLWKDDPAESGCQLRSHHTAQGSPAQRRRQRPCACCACCACCASTASRSTGEHDVIVPEVQRQFDTIDTIQHFAGAGACNMATCGYFKRCRPNMCRYILCCFILFVMYNFCVLTHFLYQHHQHSKVSGHNNI